MDWPKAKISSEQLLSLFQESGCVKHLFFPKEVPRPPIFTDGED